MIDSIALSDYFHTGATYAHEDAFVPIGHGLEVLLPRHCKNGDSWDITIEPFVTPSYVTSAMQGEQLVVSSEHEILSLIHNNLVISPNSTKENFNFTTRPPTPVQNFRSNLMTTFYNHIFLVKGRTVFWTDLDNLWEWSPLPENEADFREVEWETFDATGLARVKDSLYLHFPNAIYEVKYVGKPFIVNISQMVHGIGAVTPRSVAVHNSTQFFLGTDNFYLWSSESRSDGAVPFGSDIWKKFVASRGLVSDIWSYVDQRNNEICWVTNGTIWAFNYIERHWSKYSSEGILSHTTTPWSYGLTQITASTDPLSEWMSTISKVQPDGLENVWVTDGEVVREQRWEDEWERCLGQERPYLESDDLTFGDLHFHKRVDLVVLDAKYEFPWTGVRVFISGRDFVTHPNVWVDCGVWRKGDKSKQIDFRAVQGKVLKFRFVLEDQLVTKGRLMNGGLKLDGHVLDVADGAIRADGQRTFKARQFQPADGTVTLGELGQREKFNFFELNAWGVRVDLPTTLVGPDK